MFFSMMASNWASQSKSILGIFIKIGVLKFILYLYGYPIIFFNLKNIFY